MEKLAYSNQLVVGTDYKLVYPRNAYVHIYLEDGIATLEL